LGFVHRSRTILFRAVPNRSVTIRNLRIAAGGGGGGSDEEEEDACAACEQCGRTYPHEHVRAVRHAGYVDDGEDEDADAGAAPLIS
jgi:hypothetical protein